MSCRGEASAAAVAPAGIAVGRNSSTLRGDRQERATLIVGGLIFGFRRGPFDLDLRHPTDRVARAAVIKLRPNTHSFVGGWDRGGDCKTLRERFRSAGGN
jgi:hypothetical protein